MILPAGKNRKEAIGKLGIGALHLSIAPRPDREKAIAVLHYALRHGVTLIDTADSYCTNEFDKHHNEALVKEALDSYEGERDSIVIATKGGMIRPGGQWLACGDPRYLEKAIIGSFQALGGDRPIDLWQLHCPDPRYDIKDSLQPAATAVRSGIIRAVGLSNVSADQIRRARDVVEIVSVQNQFSLWNRAAEMEGVLEYCDRENLLFFAWSPLGGRQSHRELQNVPFLARLAAEKSVSVYSVVLAWMMSKSPVVVPIPGTTNQDHIQPWVSAGDLKLSASDIYRIECSFYGKLPVKLTTHGRE